MADSGKRLSQLAGDSPEYRIFIKGCISRLAKFKKAEFTLANEHFENKHNAIITLLEIFE